LYETVMGLTEVKKS